MERMHGIDPMFVYSETPATPMEVAYACILNPQTAPGGYSYETVRQLLAERIPTLVPFRRRLVKVPFGLDHPRWVDDPHFDIDNHLQRVAVPAPGGEHEFRTVVAEIMGRPLCPEQPPWEMYVVEDLADGLIGLVAKVHHAVIDGVAGAQLLAQLLDLAPEGRPVVETCPPWTPPALPSSTRLLTHAMPNLVSSPVRTLRALRAVGRTAVRVVRCALDGDTGPVSVPLFAPDILQKPVVADREVALAELALPDIAAVRQRFGLTINDVVLAICSGALRKHLAPEEQLAGNPLVAIVPVSVRAGAGAAAADGLGNHLSAMFVSLGNDRESPLQRLEAIVESSVAEKAQERAVGFGPLASALADLLPPLLALPVMRAGQQAGVLRRLRAGNLLVSNVPGPDFPLYFAGMRLRAVHPLGPVVDGVALNITVQSYEQSLFVGINASANALANLQALARSMEDELSVLVVAAAEPTAEMHPRPLGRQRPESSPSAKAWTPHQAPRTAVPLSHASHPGEDFRPTGRRQLPRIPKELSWD
jgi:diacylglycerol O-acyltransferase